jgi:cytochrome P450
MSSPYPPGPKGHWLKGNLRDFMDRRLEFLPELSRDYGPVASFRLGPRRVCLVNDPSLIEHILVTDNKQYIKHFGARMYRPLLGNGLLLSEGGFWLRQRRMAQPAFLKHRVTTYGATIVDLTGRLLESWQEGKACDMREEMTRLTAHIATTTFFGAEEVKDRDSFNMAIDEVIATINKRFRRLIQWPDWLPLPGNFRLKRAMRRLDAIVEGFIKQGRARTEPSDNLLSLLLHAQDEDGSRMTDRQLRDEAMTLFLAGHETTALTLAWTWWLLAQHPDVEAKLVEEWRQVLGGRAPTSQDLSQLKYTEWVIMESMRLYPPAYLIGRESATDVEVGGYRLRRGTTIFLAQWVTHRDPKYWDEPKRFLPQRWGSERVRTMPKFAYFPFGGGPRVCIGNHFAMLESMLVLATIGQRFRFTLQPEPRVKLDPKITLSPMPGIPVVLKAR